MRCDFNAARRLALSEQLLLFIVLLASANVRVLAQEAGGDAACARCHQAIYDNYKKTSMANASGPAASGFTPGRYLHGPSGIAYTVDFEAGMPALRYERAGEPHLEGSMALAYYIGSGKRGRTYLYATDGYWFQTPINWYAKRQVWDMAPGYAESHSMPFTLGVDEGCLFCHASGGRPTQPGAMNHFGENPFNQSGITCARCHGDAAAHLATGGRAAIVNSAKLSPPRRDSICQQCHLEGETTVRLAGKTANDFQTGRPSNR